MESISQKPEEMELLLARGYSYQIDGISIVNEQGRESLKVSAKLVKE
ncbi:ADP-ribosyltransferase [Bacillus wiedmannii]